MKLRAKTIGFRVDASAEIGLGHVLRCKSLARVLQQRGHRCHFICLELPETQLADLLGDDLQVHLLKGPISAEEDSKRTQASLEKIGADLLILDHYQRGSDWADAVGDTVEHIVIDDLAERSHRCSLLLDQNLGRKYGDYDGLVPENSIRLIGPRFALLRPEFLAARQTSLERRAGVTFPKSVLISMGGMDAVDATSEALRAINAIHALPSNLIINVVMGAQAPHLENVRKLTRQMRYTTNILIDLKDMASAMSQADLAIGAAGGTAWERCVLGLPTLVFAVAENQKLGAKSLQSHGAAILLPDLHPQSLNDAFSVFATDPSRLQAISTEAARLCDGRGAQRVASAVEALSLTVRLAEVDDAQAIYDWRNDGNSHQYFENPNPSPWPNHLAWLAAALSDPQRLLMMADLNGVSVCHIRFDKDTVTAGIATVGIVASPDIRGRGLAATCLLKAIQMAQTHGLSQIMARVHKDNTASHRLFLAARFIEISKDGVFSMYLLDLGKPSNS